MSELRLSFDRFASPTGSMGARATLGRPLEIAAARATAPCEKAVERPAVPLPQSQGWLLFEGRIDNRGELWRSLPSSPGPLSQLSDAALLACGYQAWGPDLFRRILGSFAVAIYDRHREEALLARDPMGGRGLAYALTRRFFLAASDEADLLADPRVDSSLDAERLACYFAMESPADGRTFFRGVRQLPPGHLLRVGRATSEVRCFWQPRLEPQAPRNEGELAEEVRALLDQAVSCRLPASGPVGVLLSGGLDSTPIAALASRALPKSRKLHSFSWVFDRHPKADERRYIAEACRRFGLEPHALRCDDELPLADLPSWPVHPTTPEQNAYRRFHQRAYRQASQAGCRLLLSGMCGDQLYTGGEQHWLAERLRQLPWRAAVVELAREATAGNLRRHHFTALLPLAWRLERQARRPERRYPWLTEQALARLGEPLERQGWTGSFLRPSQAQLLLGPANGHGFAVERHFAGLEGVELAYPLRDRRLVERFLTLPASALWRRGESRPILRRALADLLPTSVATRHDKANFSSLFIEGVYRRNVAATRRLLFNNDALWPEWVDRRLVHDALANADTGTAGVVLWLAASLELWLERRNELTMPTLRRAA